MAGVELVEVLIVVFMEDNVAVVVVEIIEAIVEVKVVAGPMWPLRTGVRDDMWCYIGIRNQQLPLQTILCDMISPNTLRSICSPEMR
jgi:hypothetical protein